MPQDIIGPAVIKVRVGTQNFALVDAQDYARVRQHTWQIDTTYRRRTKYARCFLGANGEPASSRTYVTSTSMHRMITGYRQTDHANGNGLDNRRENLRSVTNQKNRQNTPKQRSKCSSSFKGVSWDPERGKWYCCIIGANGRRIYLGRFRSETEAAKAYDAMARIQHGEFASVNFP